MRIERDARGLLHIEEDGFYAVVDEAKGVNVTYARTDEVTPEAIAKVTQAMEDRTRWPTLRMPRL